MTGTQAVALLAALAVVAVAAILGAGLWARSRSRRDEPAYESAGDGVLFGEDDR